MAWVLIHARDRSQFVAGDADGVPIFSREPRDALRFDTADAARAWMRARVCTAFGQLALLRLEKSSRDLAGRPALHYRRR